MIKELEKIESVKKITFSNPLRKDYLVKKVVFNPIQKKGKLLFFVEEFTQKQAFQKNLSKEDFLSYFDEFSKNYKQVCVVFLDKIVTYLYNGKTFKRIEKKAEINESICNSQNRQKNYLLKEGMNIPALVDLGIFTKEYKVVNSMYDKYKQINRFVEIIDDKFCDFNNDNITILDFGCGKSYLTFILYYYFYEIKRINVKIIGYDLKKDVVEHCNELAKKYNYKNLFFQVADVTKDDLADCNIDAVVSLHACDTATDYALYFAISHKVKYIFSVPCCQHEINSSILKNVNGDLDFLTRYGILKERTSALLTDSIRAMVLEDFGYDVDLMEFVDLAHSPKNLMIRAEQNKEIKHLNREKIKNLCEKYGFRQKLFDMTEKIV